MRAYSFLVGVCLGAFGCASTVQSGVGDGGDAGPGVDVGPDVPGVDTGLRPDVVPVDTAPVDVRVPRCGDRELDPGESCDDGNNTPGDGCGPTCRWEPRCGDGRVDPGEVCDDGNNRSGDGCRSDCRSDERCGNMIVDTERGEVCDGTQGCAPDCRSLTLCGNGRTEAGEQCDDGNRSRWDGCGPDCRNEQAVVLNNLAIAQDTGMLGCDFSGDRRPDNAFGRAFGMALGLFNSFVTNGISNGQLLLQLSFLNLTDPRGQNVPDVRVGWLLGADADMELTNNGAPGNPQLVQRASLRPMTELPAASFQSRITTGMLDGGPEDIELVLPAGPIGMLNFRVRRSRISGLLVADAERITELRSGVLCGAIPAQDLARLPNPASLIPGGGGGGMMSRSSFLELLVAGQRILFFTIGPQQPDIDLDGDGLEAYESNMGSLGTPPEITACIDGNGTRIPGRACVMDPRMADGFSSAFQLSGVWVALRGVREGGRMGGGGTADAGAPSDGGP
ncbi:MAG: DUF4215 domain-containing protein [Deltaproteobacteria bacterium]|nr:DUF4215 domain-containing protein [Deltaproteobacteria bacterium]